MRSLGRKIVRHLRMKQGCGGDAGLWAAARTNRRWMEETVGGTGYYDDSTRLVIVVVVAEVQ